MSRHRRDRARHHRIEGQGRYAFYGTVDLVDQPVIALVDATYPVQGLQPLLAPNHGEVIGRLTRVDSQPRYLCHCRAVAACLVRCLVIGTSKHLSEVEAFRRRYGFNRLLERKAEAGK